MKKRFGKFIIKLFITVSVLECIYLFAVPPIVNKFIDKNYISSFIEKNTNLRISADEIKFKTHLKPVITLYSKKLNIENKLTNQPIVSVNDSDIEICIFPLLFNEIAFKHFYADKLNIYILKDKDDKFNFENLFTAKGSKKIHFKGKNVEIRTDGSIITQNASSDFDINLILSTPINLKNISDNRLSGNIYLYNLNLDEIKPLIKKIIPSVENISGLIDFIQLSAEKNNNKTTEIVLNTKYNNLLYNHQNWENYIYAKGENKVNATVELYDKTIHINKLKYIADNVDITGNGDIHIKNKPVLDINVAVKNSRTENIASILPPNLVKETMIIEKVKKYGIFGEMEGEAKIQGEVPTPNIIGYANGRNIKILDKEIQKKHNGNIKLKFDNHRLHMDILLDMPQQQSAHITGTTYMYRDGVNDVTIKTTKNIDFPLAQKLTLPISDVFSFQLGPLPEMSITSGKGMIDIHINGSMDFINLYGYCTFDNADLTYNTLYGKITNTKGRLDFKDDNIYIKSERAFIEKNPFSVNGEVKINHHLNFDINTNNTSANDLQKIVNNSILLKDVKKGLALFDKLQGKVALNVNISADIVPVPFGHKPLPPEEAFINLKVKGSVLLNDLQTYLKGFNTPIKSIKGNINFTEKLVDFNDVYADLGTSKIKADGKIVTDVKTKIPDVDISITGDSIKIGDTIRFLSESYMYPKNYPDISSLYNLDGTHDLYFKYKAKAVDFRTDKAYAIMNINKQTNDSIVQTKKGKITLQNANVLIEDVNADIFDSNINITGLVKNVNKKIPIYNVIIKSDRFNIENLNRYQEVSIIPEKLYTLLSLFSNYKGQVDFATTFKNNILDMTAKVSGLSFVHNMTKMPAKFDDFELQIKNDKLTINNLTGELDNVPLYAKISASKIYNIPDIDCYFTSKLTNDFIKKYFPQNISEKISVFGEISVSSYIKGNPQSLSVKPKITLYPEADAQISGVKIGDSSDKREFNSEIKINKKEISIDNLDYYKYITTQNNNVYPVLFAYGSGKLKYNTENQKYEPDYAYIKTEKNLSAKLLNAFLDKPMFNQGTVNCDIRYKNNKLDGEIKARNIDFPLVDSLIKNITVTAYNDDINIKLFGFMNDSPLYASSTITNNLKNSPHISKLDIRAENINTNRLLMSISDGRKEFYARKKNNNAPDLSIFQIENGKLHFDSLTVKNYKAEDINSNFSIDKDGIFKLDDINVKLGEGSAHGNVLVDLKNTDISAELDFSNIDSNYLAENLLDAKDQIYGLANANFLLKSKGNSDEEILNNLSGFAYFDMTDGRMPKLGSLEYLLRASNIVKSGVTGFTINNILEILNLVKTGYFTNISGNCKLEQGRAKDIEIYSQGENLSLYIHGDYNIATSNANMEILGKLSNRISTIFGPIGNTSLNTFFKMIPGVSMFDFGNKDILKNSEKIPAFTSGSYDARTFQAIINGDINSSKSVQSFKWVN